MSQSSFSLFLLYTTLLQQLFYGCLWSLSGTTRVSWYKKGKTKTNLNFLEQEIVSGSGISWVICKSAPRPRQITMPASHHTIFTGQMPFLPPNQQCQSTVSKKCTYTKQLMA